MIRIQCDDLILDSMCKFGKLLLRHEVRRTESPLLLLSEKPKEIIRPARGGVEKVQCIYPCVHHQLKYHAGQVVTCGSPSRFMFACAWSVGEIQSLLNSWLIDASASPIKGA